MGVRYMDMVMVHGGMGTAYKSHGENLLGSPPCLLACQTSSKLVAERSVAPTLGGAPFRRSRCLFHIIVHSSSADSLPLEQRIRT